MRYARALVVAGPLLCALACADLGDLSGGGTGEADAATDAPADVASPPPVDAGDAADGGNAACPGHPRAIFCDDFDHGALGASWTMPVTAVGGSLALGMQTVETPPNALVATTPADPGTTFGAAALDVDLGAVPRALRMSYDLYVDAFGDRSAALCALSLRNGSGPTTYDLYVFAKATSVSLAEEGVYADGGDAFVTHPMPNLPLQSWVRMVLDVDLDARTATVTVEQPPGAIASPVLDHVSIAPTLTPATFSATAGLSYVGNPSTSGWRAVVDDFVVEIP